LRFNDSCERKEIYGTFYAVVLEALPGKELELKELSSRHYFAWGKL